MVTIEERVSRLEGGYEHLATKADLANLKIDLYRAIIQLGVLITTIITTIIGAAVAFLKLTGTS